MTNQNVIVEKLGNVGRLTLNRPQALNALNVALIGELNQALEQFRVDTDIGCIILSGSEKAFAAGADIREMKDKSLADLLAHDFLGAWDKVAATRKPLVAAVSGFCLGGGCELALMCDVILASPSARFGQPEVTLGIIPGAGGTQRLTRAIGKAKAMEMVLTGRLMNAEEAERAGLVSRIVAAENLQAEALAVAQKIAGLSQPVIAMAKEAVNRAFESSLSEGLRFERRQFHSGFALNDQKEGMAAFLDKRPARFTNS